MLKPVRTTAGWLGGRLVLLLIIIAALVASDAYRDEFSLLTAQLRGLLPDRELVGRLEAGREQLEKDAAEQTERGNRGLRDAAARAGGRSGTRQHGRPPASRGGSPRSDARSPGRRSSAARAYNGPFPS